MQKCLVFGWVNHILTAQLSVLGSRASTHITVSPPNHCGVLHLDLGAMSHRCHHTVSCGLIVGHVLPHAAAGSCPVFMQAVWCCQACSHPIVLPSSCGARGLSEELPLTYRQCKKQQGCTAHMGHSLHHHLFRQQFRQRNSN